MSRLSANLAVYLHRGTIDFRKSINGLSALVEHELRLDPFAHAVYVFGNRRKDRIKILGWSSNGFWLLQKRLENARFVRPREDTVVVEITVQQLHCLLDGIDLAATLTSELRFVSTERDLFKERLDKMLRKFFAAKSEARGTEQKDMFFNEAEALAAAA